MRAHPHLYQINTAVWLERLSCRHSRRLTLNEVPDKEWKAIRARGMDAVWLMGVWQRSPEARRRALAEPNLRKAFDSLLPDWKEEDVWGSPYAVYGYEPDARIAKGGEALADLRTKLHQIGLRLILDFVPNHLAMDHPWTLQHPQWFVRGRGHHLIDRAAWFFQTPDEVYLAHGRDPHFHPWTDTVQINAFSPDARRALVHEMTRIAGWCDGVRCDMAMLLLNDIFRRTWDGFEEVSAGPSEEFWPSAIEEVKKVRPPFVFIAEAYWDLEWRLQQMGFDFTYDKALYDRLFSGPAASVQDHLGAEPAYLNRTVHFIENHDEKRAIDAFGRKKSMAAAAVIGTVPGMRFFYEGQAEGRRFHWPVHLAREKSQKPDPGMRTFYKSLFAFMDDRILHEGQWELLKGGAFGEGPVLSWIWRRRQDFRWVILNYGEQSRAAEGVVFPDGKPVECREVLSGRDLLTERASDGSWTMKLEPWQVLLIRGSFQ